jgi:glycine/D-amino acid oxidase-like deaminating enzyme
MLATATFDLHDAADESLSSRLSTCTDQVECDELFKHLVTVRQRVLDFDFEEVEVGQDEAESTCVSDKLAPLIAHADHKVVIIGSGPAGLTAALYAARADLQPLVLSSDGGQLESTSWVDNYPGFAEGVDAVTMLLALQTQATRFGALFQPCTVRRIDVGCRPFKIYCGTEAPITTSSLIIATGASPRWLGVPGERELLSKGVHTCATCDGYFYKGREVAVVGGGDSAMEMALFLARLCTKVTVVHRRGLFRASKAMAARVLRHPQIEVISTREASLTLGVLAPSARTCVFPRRIRLDVSRHPGALEHDSRRIHAHEQRHACWLAPEPIRHYK